MAACAACLSDNLLGDTRSMGGRLCETNLAVTISAQFAQILGASSSFIKRRHVTLRVHRSLTAVLALETLYFMLLGLGIPYAFGRTIFSASQFQTFYVTTGWFGIQALTIVPCWIWLWVSVSASKNGYSR